MTSTLSMPGPHADAHAPVLVHFLHGAIDAGSASRLAMEQLLDATVVGRVATFNTDELVDYRASRPVAMIKDWTLASVETPQIALDLAADLEGNPFFILHGPEPDFRWEAFAEAVRVISQRAEVQTAISLVSVPAAVPHTRSVRVHRTTTMTDQADAAEVEMSLLSVATSASMFLQDRLSRQSAITSLGLVASVPYYLHESDYFPAATQLIQAVGAVGNLALPVGDVEAASHQLAKDIAEALQVNTELQSLVDTLEERFDAMADATEETVSAPTLSFDATAIPSPDEIGASLDSFLRFEQARAEGAARRVEESRFPRRPRRGRVGHFRSADNDSAGGSVTGDPGSDPRP